MNFKDFSEQALKTESRPEKFLCNPELVFLTLSLAFELTQFADAVKKAAFYGKPLDGAAEKLLPVIGCASFILDNQELFTNLEHRTDITAAGADSGPCANNDVAISDLMPKMNIRLAHAFLGGLTEHGELIGALMDALVNNKEIDRTNVGEEYGDTDWYKAIAFDELKLEEWKSRMAVIEKLRKRYGDKFSADAAINRNVEQERVVLEENIGN